MINDLIRFLCCTLMPILLLCGWTTTVAAQLQRPATLRYDQFRYDHLGFADGLKSQRVYSIAEGRHGSMWFTMKSGVARYNGHQLKHYTMGTGGDFSEAGGLVIRLTTTPDQKLLAYDNKGHLYVYHTGIDHFVPYAERFTQLFHQIDNSYRGLTLNSVCVDMESWMWIATSQGLFVVRPFSETIVHWDAQANVIGVECCGRHMLVYTQQGAYLIHREKGSKLRQLTEAFIGSAYYDAQYQQLWLGTADGEVLRYQTSDEASGWKRLPIASTSAVAATEGGAIALHKQLPALPVMAIEPLDDSTMLLGLDGAGVYVTNRQAAWAATFTPLFSQDDAQGGVIHGNGIYDIERDHEGNIWICSYTGGVDVAYPTGQRMELFEHRKDMERSLMNNGVNAALEWNGQLVFGTDRGVSILNPQSNSWVHTLRGRVVLALCADGNDLLVGTYGEGVYRITPSGEYHKAYSSEQGNLESNHVYSLYKGEKATARSGLWIGCLSGSLMHYTEQKIQRFDIQTVECMVPMPNGHLAVGTAHGFFDVDPERGLSTHYLLGEEVGEQRVNNYVKDMLFASADTAWIATDGGGLYAYHLSTRTFKRYSTADGLNSNCIYGLAYDEQGRIVCSTDCGLSIFYPSTGKAININHIPGVEREYNRAAVAPLADGRLLFGSNNGAVLLNPRLIAPISYEAPLHFLGVRVREELTTTQQTRLYETLREGSIFLSYAYRTFEVEFESINYRYRADIQYQYLLEGFSRDWSTPSEQGVARFENLAAGSYVLKVRCVSRISGRIIDEQQIAIAITSPWWNSFWAWVIYLILATLLGWLTLRIIARYFGTIILRFKPKE